MDRLISSSAVRLVGLGLLAVAVVLGPGEARASALASGCVEIPWIACERCYGVERDKEICDVTHLCRGTYNLLELSPSALRSTAADRTPVSAWPRERTPGRDRLEP